MQNTSLFYKFMATRFSAYKTLGVIIFSSVRFLSKKSNQIEL
jgi:hypothetical protein